jgi:hypothetical protein
MHPPTFFRSAGRLRIGLSALDSQLIRSGSMSGQAGLLLLNVFLFEAEFFGGVQDKHFHADVGGHAGGGRFGDDDHEQDREGHRPDGRLFAEDAEERMLRPVGIEWP